MHKCILASSVLSARHKKARTWRALLILVCQSAIGGYLPLTESL